MSKININRNIFLEKEELMRFQKFMLESPTNKLFLSNTTNWGIISTSEETSPPDFKVETGTNSGTVKIASLSRAIDEDGLLIEQSIKDNILIPNDGQYYWLKIGHTYNKFEQGTLNVSADGTVTGTGTAFTEVLRGQSTEVPVKVKLDSDNNTQVYEVLDVTNDTNMILQGDNFTPESGINYRVIGTTPFGDTVTTDQQDGLYFYDSCDIIQVLETVTEEEPAGLVSNKEFWIARVVNNLGTVTIEDKRDGFYWEFYLRGVSDKLTKTENLGDLTNVENARDNLQVYSVTQVNDLLNVDETEWKVMNKGSNIDNDDFDVKIKRVGSVVTISGKFKANNDQKMDPGDIIAYIPYSSISSKAGPGINVYFQLPQINPQGDRAGTDGLGCKIESYLSSQDTLEIKVTDDVRSYYPEGAARSNIFGFTLTYIA